MDNAGFKQFTQLYQRGLDVHCEIEFKNTVNLHPNSPDKYKSTPCNYLVSIGAPKDFIAYLIAMGADPNQRDQYGWNTVAWACLTKQATYLKQIDNSLFSMQKAGLDLNITVPVGWNESEGLTTPLCHVICYRKDDRNLLKHVLEATQDVNFKATHSPGYHVLIEASKGSNYENLISLIDSFWEDRIKTISGNEPNPDPHWFNFDFTIATSLSKYTQNRDQLVNASVLFFMVMNRIDLRLVRHVIDRIVDYSFVDVESGVSAFSLALLTGKNGAVQLMLEDVLNVSRFHSQNHMHRAAHDWRSEVQK